MPSKVQTGPWLPWRKAQMQSISSWLDNRVALSGGIRAFGEFGPALQELRDTLGLDQKSNPAAGR